MASMKTDLFFSRFHIIDRIFPNLRALTLTSIDYETWCLFKIRFPPLITNLSIDLLVPDSLECSSTAYDVLSELLFLSPFLQRLSVKMAGFIYGDPKIRPPNSTTTSSIQYFYFDYMEIDLLSILAVAPMLHTVEGYFDTPDLKSEIIHLRLLYLQRLRIELCTITWIDMVALFSLFPRLIHFILIAVDVNSDMADGFAWSDLLQRIESFHFKLTFSYFAFAQQPFYLHLFRTKFWIEEKKWFVTCDRTPNNSNCSMLYSNSSVIVCPPKRMFETPISETTSPEPISSPLVYHLRVDDEHLKYPLLHRYTHIKELYLSEVTMTFKDLATYFDISQLTKCYIDHKWNRNPSLEHIEFLCRLPHLCKLNICVTNLSYLFHYQWPRIVSLTITNDHENSHTVLSLNDVEAICHSFPHIKHLDIHLLSICDPSQLINRMKMKLTNIIIRQPHKIDSEPLITREWIERNTDLQNFHYVLDKRDKVQLWL